MINMGTASLHLRGNVFEIKKWEVWFQTPFGLMESHDDAITFCKSRDLDPTLCVIPVPVALGDNGDYEAFQR